MSDDTQLRTLISELEKGMAVLSRIGAFHDDYVARTQGARAQTPEQAIVLADIFASYYTCAETLLLRASRFFENSLAPEKWRQDLLQKMALSIAGIREAVLSDQTVALLSELLKFRHFKRYYFEFQYDWDRLTYLRRQFEQVRPLLAGDMDRFLRFLRGMLGGPDSLA
jgi:hypothetical protein